MAKTTIDRELFDILRARGLRKRVARTLSEASGAGRTAGGRAEASARKAVTELRKAADEIEDRLRSATGTTRTSSSSSSSGTSASRSAAAKKGARTRQTQANK